MSEILCENLSIGYDGKVVYENINFSIMEGDYLCILGENGAGKSTLMKTLLGLQKHIDGKILINGVNLNSSIGYLPQQTTIQRDFPASVYEVVLSGCLSRQGIRPFYNKREKTLAYENMVKMEISDLAKKSYRDLSGGQQQRVLLARALCATKKMLLLDEPVGGLDPRATFEMYELIKKLNQEEKITIIMISHDLESSIESATHILHIGKEYFFGTKEEYLTSDNYKSYHIAERLI